MATLVELKLKAQLLRMIIKEAQRDGDQRWENLIPQQERINAMLVAAIREDRQRRGIPEPTPIVIGLKPIDMSGKAKNPGDDWKNPLRTLILDLRRAVATVKGD